MFDTPLMDTQSETGPATGGDKRSEFNYRGPEQVCATCDHFKDGQCSAGNFECDEGGSCDRHSMNEPAGEDEASESADMEDMEEL